MSRPRVVVALSGGVDSAVAAALLQKEGYAVLGVTLRLWDAEKPGTSENDSAAAAADICRRLNIEHQLLDHRREFHAAIIEDFAREYLRGRTPNPCVLCNREIKWRLLLEHAERIHAEYIATGHYARLLWPDGEPRLAAALHGAKDQSYALWNLPRRYLARTLLPLGDLDKTAIRRLAAELNLPVHDRPESQDICFVPDGDYRGFLAAHFTERMKSLPPGPLLDRQGNRVGNHRGIAYYTIGQRKGLGVALGAPHFVSAIDPGDNTITITPGEGLWRQGLIAHRANWLIEAPREPLTAQARIRYHDEGAPCRVVPREEDSFEVRFAEPRRAITPGQSVVLYDGDLLLGGGIIGESCE